MKKLNFSWLQKFFNSTIAFGSKNAPTIMTGGSIVLGWAAVYVFWKQSKKAEEEIVATEEKLFVKREEGEDVEAVLPAKEKAIIYLKHCWPAALMGLGSTAGTVWAHKMDLSRLAEMYMLTQFLEGKNSDQEKLIEKLRGEVSGKKFKELRDEITTEKYPESSVGDGYIEETGKGTTLFIEETTGIKFRSSITEVQKGFYEFKDILKTQRDRAIKMRFGDAFFASDNPYQDDLDVFSSEGYDVFLECIGIKQHTRLGDILEFRYYGNKEFLPVDDETLCYKPFVDPVTGVPSTCYIRVGQYLSPTYELTERNPL